MSFVSSISSSKTAIVLIEYQNEFTTEGGKLYPACKAVIDDSNMLFKTAQLVNIAREKGIKIVHVPISFSDNFNELSDSPYGILADVKNGQCFVASQWGAEICAELTPAAGDIIIQGKKGLCGFHSTNLDFVLRQNGIDTIALGGFLTNW